MIKLKDLFNENNISKINKFYKNDPKSLNNKKENVKLTKLLNKEVKKLASTFNSQFTPDFDETGFSDEPYTGAIGKVNGAQVRVEFAGDGGRFSGPSIEMINFGIKHKLKGRESIKDIAKLIIKLIDKI